MELFRNDPDGVVGGGQQQLCLSQPGKFNVVVDIGAGFPLEFSGEIVVLVIRL